MSKKGKKRILLSLDWFAPGYKAGGPIRSCVNFAYAMRDTYEIYVITGNKDFGETQVYPGIESGTWTVFEDSIQVKYCEADKLSRSFWKKEFKDINPDFIYINNLFSKNYGLLPLLVKSSAPKNATWILSPRGILRESAIQYKTFKKKVYIGLLRFFGVQNSIHFLVTDKQESHDVKKYFGTKSKIKVIGNFPFSKQNPWKSRKKESGKLKLVFFARIGPIKNLDYILELLKSCKHLVSMDIIGPIEDPSYWSHCQAIISELGENIKVNYVGELPHEQIMGKLGEYHLFTLATQGENFGHAIFEAILAACPILISDQTPWLNLEKEKVGWALPLSQKEKFKAAIEQMALMDQETWDSWSLATWNYGKNYLENSKRKQDYEELFS